MMVDRVDTGSRPASQFAHFRFEAGDALLGVLRFGATNDAGGRVACRIATRMLLRWRNCSLSAASRTSKHRQRVAAGAEQRRVRRGLEVVEPLRR